MPLLDEFNINALKFSNKPTFSLFMILLVLLGFDRPISFFLFKFICSARRLVQKLKNFVVKYQRQTDFIFTVKTILKRSGDKIKSNG